LFDREREAREHSSGERTLLPRRRRDPRGLALAPRQPAARGGPAAPLRLPAAFARSRGARAPRRSAGPARSGPRQDVGGAALGVRALRARGAHDRRGGEPARVAAWYGGDALATRADGVPERSAIARAFPRG